jgi:hypothetical protein
MIFMLESIHAAALEMHAAMHAGRIASHCTTSMRVASIDRVDVPRRQNRVFSPEKSRFQRENRFSAGALRSTIAAVAGHERNEGELIPCPGSQHINHS